MTKVGWKYMWSVIATATTCLAFTLSLSAQVETTTTTAKGNATVVTKVERGEVVTVSGNDLVVKMADGTIRHFPNVPESARVTVNGKQLGVHDLKPGMKLQRTITTTSTPMIVTTVQTVKGKVWEIVAPLSIILTLEDGKNQRFKIPEGQKFNVDGEMLDAFAVRKGMILTATKIVEEPTSEITQEKTVTGEVAPAPDAPILVAEGSEEPVPTPTAAPATAPAAAPEAASGLPTWLIWLLVLVVLAAIIWWYMNRKKGSGS
jgi:RNase P/RNase MRP subunit p29